MNPIIQLIEPNYLLHFLEKNILPQYPQYKKIKKIKIVYFKKNIWETTYHVVIEIKTTFINKSRQEKTLPIFFSAHSSEPRDLAFNSLKTLWESNFKNKKFCLPRPLFYSKEFNAFFYEGLIGYSLLDYLIKRDDYKTTLFIKQSAQLIAHLHKTKINNLSDFKNINPQNNLIKNVVPGVKNILEKIKDKYKNKYFNDIENIYKKLIFTENEFLKSTSKRWLIHGDLHPQNLIIVNQEKMGIIDFTDIGLTDFARDLGTFMQQINYKCVNKLRNKGLSEKLNQIFLDEYLKLSNIKLNNNLKNRIKNYYAWTMMRTAIFHFLRHDTNEDRGKELLEKTKDYLRDEEGSIF